MSNEALILAGIEVAKLWLDYAQRAGALTREQAIAEWSRVQARATAARMAWERAANAPDP